MQTLHDPASAPSLARQYHDRHKERVARIERRAYVQPVPPGPPEPIKVEIIEIMPSETVIEVIACNGQVVIVTESEVIEANNRFYAAVSGDRPSVDAIQRVVARHYNVSRSDILSPRRTANIIWPRQVAMYLCKMLTILSLPQIGRKFGGRDHTTVLHATRKMAALVEQDESIRAEVQNLSSKISETNQ